MTVVIDNGINDLNENDFVHGVGELLVLASCLKSYIDQHGDANQSFDVLRALTSLTIDWVGQGKESTHFTALNVLAQANIPTSEGKSASAKLSPLWKKLVENILPTREKGIQDFARNQGLKFFLWPEKDKSEGGRPSEYFLKARRVTDSEMPTIESLGPGQIAYIRELTPKPSWWARPILKNGYRLEGWRRWLFLAYGVGSIMVVAIALMLLWSLFWFLPIWPIKEFFLSISASAFIIFAFWMILGPLFRLLEWRIVMAPASLVALNELNVQMEIVRETNSISNSPGTIRLVRYASTCPQCHSKIEIVEGGKEFPNRLVGRCRENPGEHIYSFDRFTCKGHKLRQI